MSLFEYLAIAFSLLFSFSAMRLVGGLPHSLQSDRRYWVHLSLVCLQLLATVTIFWGFWSFRSITWDFPRFVLVLANPGVLYFNACALIPESPSAIESWRSYYYSIRQRYFAGVICWVVVITAIATWVLELPWHHPLRAFHMALLVFGVLGATSTNHRVHAGLMLALFMISVIGITTLLWRPGPLTP